MLLRPAQADDASAAATRWRIGTAEAARDRFGLLARTRWRARLERCRNGRPGEWLVEFDHAAYRFSLAPPLADPALSRRAGAHAARAAPVDPARPFVLAADVSGTPRVTAANAAAEADGIRIGEALADARAKTERLQVRAADPAADDAALRALALWATRYTPAVAAFGETSGRDGLFLDVAGAAHLFGGEASLIDDLAARLAPDSACRRGPRSPTPPAPPGRSRGSASRARSWRPARKAPRWRRCRSRRCA